MLAVSAPPSQPGSLPGSPSSHPFRSFSKSPSPRRLLGPGDGARTTPSPRASPSRLPDDVPDARRRTSTGMHSPSPMSPAGSLAPPQQQHQLSLPGIHDLLPDHVFEAQQRESKSASKPRNPEPFGNAPSFPISVPRTPVPSYTLSSPSTSTSRLDAPWHGRHTTAAGSVPSSPLAQQPVRHTHGMNTSFTFPRLPVAPVPSQQGSRIMLVEAKDIKRKERERRNISVDASSAAAGLLGLSLGATDPLSSDPPAAAAGAVRSHEGKRDIDMDVADPHLSSTPATHVAAPPPRTSTDPEDEDEDEDDELAGDDDNEGGDDGEQTAPTSVDSHASKPSGPGSDTDQMDVEQSGTASSTENAGSTAGGEDGKRHACPHCSKRFNRPSSLRIHLNTHTGAKPFECPFPGCGRQFNVSSNMRRHYRNHSSPAGLPSGIVSAHLVSVAPPALGTPYAGQVASMMSDPRVMHVPLPPGTRLVPQLDARMRPQYHLPFQLQGQHRMEPLAEHVIRYGPRDEVPRPGYVEGMVSRHRHARSMPNAHPDAYANPGAQGIRIARRHPQSPSLDMHANFAERDRRVVYDSSVPQLLQRAPVAHPHPSSPIPGYSRSEGIHGHERRLQRMASEQHFRVHATQSLSGSPANRALHRFSPSLPSLEPLPQREQLSLSREHNDAVQKERYSFLQSPPIVASASLPSTQDSWRGHAHTHSAPSHIASRSRAGSDFGPSSLTLPPIRDVESGSDRMRTPPEAMVTDKRSQDERRQALLRELDNVPQRLRCDSTSARTGHDSETDEEYGSGARRRDREMQDVEMSDLSRESDGDGAVSRHRKDILTRQLSTRSEDYGAMSMTASTMSDSTEVATLSSARDSAYPPSSSYYGSPRMSSSRALSRERSHSISHSSYQTHSRAGSTSSSGHGHGHHPYALARHAHSRSRDAAFSPTIPPAAVMHDSARPPRHAAHGSSSSITSLASIPSPPHGTSSMPIRRKQSIRYDEEADRLEGEMSASSADMHDSTSPAPAPAPAPRSKFPSYTFPPPKPPAGMALTSAAGSRAD